ncbi:hypothetical protein I4U23_009657 [Adineta vaga]|nr:hypothetical protein I4U23_009657 [Adineta vaga]
MVSSSIIYTILFIMSLAFFIDSMHAISISNKDDSDDSSAAKIFDYDLFSKKAASDFNEINPEEIYSLLLGKRQMASRGVRLPSESILLGKRRLPSESILLGKRRLPSESILLGKRRLPSESILLGKRRLPDEAVLLGRRYLPNEAILLGKRR